MKCCSQETFHGSWYANLVWILATTWTSGISCQIIRSCAVGISTMFCCVVYKNWARVYIDHVFKLVFSSTLKVRFSISFQSCRSLSTVAHVTLDQNSWAQNCVDETNSEFIVERAMRATENGKENTIVATLKVEWLHTSPRDLFDQVQICSGLDFMSNRRLERWTELVDDWTVRKHFPRSHFNKAHFRSRAPPTQEERFHLDKSRFTSRSSYPVLQKSHSTESVVSSHSSPRHCIQTATTSSCLHRLQNVQRPTQLRHCWVRSLTFCSPPWSSTKFASQPRRSSTHAESISLASPVWVSVRRHWAHRSSLHVFQIECRWPHCHDSRVSTKVSQRWFDVSPVRVARTCKAWWGFLHRSTQVSSAGERWRQEHHGGGECTFACWTSAWPKEEVALGSTADWLPIQGQTCLQWPPRRASSSSSGPLGQAGQTRGLSMHLFSQVDAPTRHCSVDTELICWVNGALHWLNVPSVRCEVISVSDFVFAPTFLCRAHLHLGIRDDHFVGTALSSDWLAGPIFLLACDQDRGMTSVFAETSWRNPLLVRN